MPFTLQYQLSIKGGRCAVYSIFLYIEGGQCANDSAIPVLLMEVGRCVLRKSTVVAWKWKLKGVSLTLRYRLWMEGERCVNNSAIPFLNRKGKVCPLLCNTISGW